MVRLRVGDRMGWDGMGWVGLSEVWFGKVDSWWEWGETGRGFWKSCSVDWGKDALKCKGKEEGGGISM